MFPGVIATISWYYCLLLFQDGCIWFHVVCTLFLLSFLVPSTCCCFMLRAFYYIVAYYHYSQLLVLYVNLLQYLFVVVSCCSTIIIASPWCPLTSCSSLNILDVVFTHTSNNYCAYSKGILSNTWFHTEVNTKNTSKAIVRVVRVCTLSCIHTSTFWMVKLLVILLSAVHVYVDHHQDQSCTHIYPGLYTQYIYYYKNCREGWW